MSPCNNLIAFKLPSNCKPGVVFWRLENYTFCRVRLQFKVNQFATTDDLVSIVRALWNDFQYLLVTNVALVASDGEGQTKKDLLMVRSQVFRFMFSYDTQKLRAKTVVTGVMS